MLLTYYNLVWWFDLIWFGSLANLAQGRNKNILAACQFVPPNKPSDTLIAKRGSRGWMTPTGAAEEISLSVWSVLLQPKLCRKQILFARAFALVNSLSRAKANANNESHPIRGGVGWVLRERVCPLEQCDCSLSCSNRTVQWPEERGMH